MSGQLSKRQQARNERILQDLIKTVPGNNVCADCQARNPGWASWSLGIFLCMRCAALHRKLGTHITKVKSLSMDSWSYEQVETMKRIGNLASNRIYNPHNTKPPIHYDADTSDSAMERYIRQKYQEKKTKAHEIPSSESPVTEDEPPPLPPKTGNWFGLKSTSSIFSLSPKCKKELISEPGQNCRQKLSYQNKPSKALGLNIEGDADYDSKNSKLSGMGSTDQKNNLVTLKEIGGYSEKPLESLVCLGEGDKLGPKHGERPVYPFIETSKASVGQSSDGAFHSNSLKSSGNSLNFLESRTPIAQPQSSQSTGCLPGQTNSISFQSSTSNKIGLMSSESPLSLDQAFQTMSLNKSQSLFPNRTGPGFPIAQAPQLELNQQPMTPPIPSVPQQYHSTFHNFAQSPMNNFNCNPFIQKSDHSLIQNTNNLNLYHNLTCQNFQQNPIPHFSTYKQPSTPFDYSVQQPNQPSNLPFHDINSLFPQQFSHLKATSQSLDTMGQTTHNRVVHQHSNLKMPQPSNKFDTRSILELYNYPQLAPNRPVLEQQPTLNANICSPMVQKDSNTQISLVTPVASTRNPFASSLSSPDSEVKAEQGSVPIVNQHASQESFSLDTGGWMDGRHSPDAWRSISARSMR